MIAEIDHQRDITVYLEKDEIVKIKKERLEGIFVRTNAPRIQGKIFVSVNNERGTSGYSHGINVDDSHISEGYWELFVSNWAYQTFLEKGKLGLRYGTVGSKVSLYDISKTDYSELHPVDMLKFYVENKEKLEKRFKEEGF